jgi:hypothetical protein
MYYATTSYCLISCRGLQLDYFLEPGSRAGGLSSFSVVLTVSPMSAGNWGLAALVLRKVLLRITEPAINTITSPITNSLNIIHAL